MSNYKSYFLKSMGLREDSLPGGKGDATDPAQVDQEQLAMGIKTEMEHTQDLDLAREIAMDHLAEDPQYYSNLKNAGMADELPNGQQPPNQKPMQMQKLMSPTAIVPTPVIGMAVRGTRSGGLPAGGKVEDPEKSRLGGWEQIKVLPKGGAVADLEKARLGGLELVRNPKANSQGAFASTPLSDALKADGGHYTPDNKEISKGKGPETSKKGGDEQHPMQFQQMGNPPPKDDGTGRNGEGLKPTENKPTEPHPMSGPLAGTEGGTGGEKDLSKAGIDDEPSEEDEEPKKGPWGIELDDEEDDEEEEGEDVSIDIKEGVEECGSCGCGNPADKHSMKDRFQQLANIKEEDDDNKYAEYDRHQKALDASHAESMPEPYQYKLHTPSKRDDYTGELPVDEAGLTSEAAKIQELKELVGRLNAKGKVTPLLQKAQAYLVKRGK